MSRDDESRFPLPPIPFLGETIDLVSARLERARLRGVIDHKATLNKLSGKYLNDRDVADVELPEIKAVIELRDPAESLMDEESVAESAPTVDAPSDDDQQTVVIYDPEAARKQLNDCLPFAENSLAKHLQSMVVPGAERRKFAIAEQGMADACRLLIDELPSRSSRQCKSTDEAIRWHGRNSLNVGDASATPI